MLETDGDNANITIWRYSVWCFMEMNFFFYYYYLFEMYNEHWRDHIEKGIILLEQAVLLTWAERILRKVRHMLWSTSWHTVVGCILSLLQNTGVSFPDLCNSHSLTSQHSNQGPSGTLILLSLIWQFPSAPDTRFSHSTGPISSIHAYSNLFITC